MKIDTRPRAKTRIIRSFTGTRPGWEHLGRREWVLHATKGWRHYRATACT